jgi:serine protease Do
VVSIIVEKEIENIYNLTGPFAPFGVLGNPTVEPGQKQRVGGGTGFIISADGLILTNKHVVLDEDAEYSVVFNDGRSFSAEVLGRDFGNDLAVLKIDAQDLPTLELGDSESLQIGQTVIAIGYTLGQYQNTVTKGVISGIDRQVNTGGSLNGGELIDEAIQTDAAINPGNSGGPLLDLNGKVVGINTAVNREGESIGFAIPVDIAKSIVTSVEKYGRIVRPWLGIRYTMLNESMAEANELSVTYGAYIVNGSTPNSAIVPGSPAEQAGLQVDDIIVAINGETLKEKSLRSALEQFQPDETIVLTVIRGDEELTIEVTLTERTQ